MAFRTVKLSVFIDVYAQPLYVSFFIYFCPDLDKPSTCDLYHSVLCYQSSPCHEYLIPPFASLTCLEFAVPVSVLFITLAVETCKHCALISYNIFHPFHLHLRDIMQHHAENSEELLVNVCRKYTPIENRNTCKNTLSRLKRKKKENITFSLG